MQTIARYDRLGAVQAVLPQRSNRPVWNPTLVGLARGSQKWLHSFGQFFFGINKVTALRFQAAIAAPVLLK